VCHEPTLRRPEEADSLQSRLRRVHARPDGNGGLHPQRSGTNAHPARRHHLRLPHTCRIVRDSPCHRHSASAVKSLVTALRRPGQLEDSNPGPGANDDLSTAVLAQVDDDPSQQQELDVGVTSSPHSAPTPNAPVLVIGAGGKTGTAVVRALTARGVKVRAAIRTERSRGRANAAGASECTIVDLATGRGLGPAIEGVGSIYHLAPNVHPDEVGIAKRVANEAAAQGVTRLVFHSVLHPHDHSMPHHLRKADAEELIRATVPALTVLQSAPYLQNLLDAALAGRIEVPYSLDAPFTLVDLQDVAEVAARVLTEQGHDRATYELAGPELTTVRGLASVASDTLGRQVVAVETDRAAWSTGPGADLADSARCDLLAMFAAYDIRGLVGNATVLTLLLGRPPRTWRDLVAASKYTQHLTRPDRSSRTRTP